MTASSEHAARPVLAAAHHVCGFVQDTALCNRPFASLLQLAKACVAPAGLCGSQVWSPGSLSDVLWSFLQSLHLNFFQGQPRRESVYVNLLCERGHGPLQFHGFGAAIKIYNGAQPSISATLKQVLQADLKLWPWAKTCWVSDILRALEGLWGCNTYTKAFLQPLVTRITLLT